MTTTPQPNPTPAQPWSFDPAIEWKMLEPAEFVKALDMWEGVGAGHLPDDVNIFVADLPFYQKHKLYCVLGTVSGELRHCFMLHGEYTVALNGTSPPIHEINKVDPISLNRSNAICYLRFFLSFVHSDGGAFFPVERIEQLTMPPNLNESEMAYAQRCLDILRVSVLPIVEVDALDSEYVKDTTVYSSVIYYGDSVFICRLQLQPSGMIEMLTDDPVVKEIPLGMVAKPVRACKIDELLAKPLDEEYTHVNGVKIRQPVTQNTAYQAPNQNTAQDGNASTGSFSLPSDREITRAYIAILTKHALNNSEHWDFVSEFNRLVLGQDELIEFSNYVLSHGPVVLIESEIPFIEELVADLVGEVAKVSFSASVSVKRIDRESDSADLKHSAIILLNPNDFVGNMSRMSIDRIAFDFSKSKNPAFIGTNHRLNLPDAFSNVIELELSIPRLNPALFEQLFKKLLGGNLPRNWKRNGTQWVGYLTPHDFHQPCKMGLTGSKAYQYLFKRVKERLNKVDTQDSPALADLHGMAEAKQMAEDLIADIQGALKKQIPWSAVDRGMLFSGPPGTGKTTLAKAIAKGCGVRFIAVSASTWHSAGYMSEHLRAMRASFAEARRYAPSILFIDEMDSFSNRENHVGNNATYNTEIVNALLAEIQGFDNQKPVFVIGATNFPDKVDPALRRAGRLDKLVYIPRPNVEALKSIYDYYLGKKDLVGEINQSVDSKFLAGLSFGLTGADVESIVRGAARRARKAQQSVNQQMLIDEITGKSRNTQNNNRLSPEEMHRVAAHESGHALLQILTEPAQIAYVSIVPRENGSLGFVASMPSAQRVRTRKAYVEYLQVLLAGRAAEEIIFGQENISSGAGGNSANSDLAIATNLAANLVCNMGMSKSSTLIWSNTPSPTQMDEVEKLLQEAYHSALAKLESNQKSLEALINALLEKQELMGSEVVKIIEAK